jgi:glycine cleavage system H protein
VGGEVTELNEELLDTPEILNADPYDGGWLLKFKMDDPSEHGSLLSPSAYSDYCDERS